MSIIDRLSGRRGPGGKRRAVDLESLREPAIWLAREEGYRTLSRLGGLPSLPDTIDWPRQTMTGLPLHFLAQIDLSRLPPTPLEGASSHAPLPRQGMLFFFADLEEEMLWDEEDRGGSHAATRVLFAVRPGPDRRPPDDAPEIGHGFGEPAGGRSDGTAVFPARPLRPFVIDTFAGLELYFQGPDSKRGDAATMASIERATGKPVPVVAWPGRDGEHFPAAWFEWPPPATAVAGNTLLRMWRRAIDTLRPPPVQREARIKRHQMLGAATNVQGAAAEARNMGRILLLQLDSDTAVHRDYTFCDMGMVQFWIEPGDLAARRFERAWGTTEGG